MVPKKQSPHRLLVLVVILSIIGGFLGGALTVNLLGGVYMEGEDGQAIQKVVEKTAYVEESAVIDTVKKVSPAVVSIVVTKDLTLYKQRPFGFEEFFFNDPFFDFPFMTPELDEEGNIQYERRKMGGGSGFIVTKEGLIVTNKHVVEDLEAYYTVIMNDGTEYQAEVISRDPLNDIAVVRITDSEGNGVDDLPVVELGSSADLQVGQRVVAIGNALAEYENTVTTGVISAKGREITAGTVRETETLINLLQTDAAINPGNSGGPLVNLDGQVIGINVAIASGAQGIGFAIPVDDIKPIIESIKEHGRIIRPFLGVRYMLLDEKRAEELKIDVEGGALLVGNEAEGEFAVIPGSPADKAGLQIKDVILEVDGKKITVDTPLQNLIGEKAPGNTITLKVWRGGEILELKATLAEAK